LFLERDPGTGALTKIEATYLNGGRMESSGLDATLAYRADLAWAPLAPALSVDVLYSYTNKMIVRNIYDDAPFDEAGLANFPRHQIYATGSLETDRFKTLWTVRRRGEAQTIAGSEIPESRLPPTTYVDVGLQFRPSDSVILYAGVENLFDKDLPVAAFAEGGFLAAFYDPIGRRYFAGAKMEF
jgi:outer membrane receptor protein involved in Fe transport